MTASAPPAPADGSTDDAPDEAPPIAPPPFSSPEELRELLRYLEPVERMELFAALEGRKERQQTFREFIAARQPKFEFSWHNERLIARCQDVADGVLTRLIVSEPPRHGKSWLVSRLLPAYWLYRHPETFVGLAAYGDTLVKGHSRAAQTYFEASGGIILPEVSAVSHWETPDGGGLWTAGIRGGAMGKGFSLGVIDDPYKNEKEAQSDTIRTTVEGFFDSTFYSRQAPGAAIVVIMTRWHEEDLVAWLIRAEGDAEDTPEGWHVISFDAIHEKNEFDAWRSSLPSSVTVEPDPRADGEALWPGSEDRPRWDVRKLRKIRRRYGGPTGYRWRCLYQQRPAPQQGGLVNVALFQIVDRAPPLIREVRGWDLAATAGCGSWDEVTPDNLPNDDADWTCGVRSGYDQRGDYYVSDMVFGQWGLGARDAVLRRTAKADGRSVHQRGEQDPGSAGKADARAFQRLLAGFPSSTDTVDQKKELKAGPAISTLEQGRYYLVRGAWNEPFRKWMRAFGPGAKWDDVPDAWSIGHNWLAMFELRDLGFDPAEQENGPDEPDEGADGGRGSRIIEDFA